MDKKIFQSITTDERGLTQILKDFFKSHPLSLLSVFICGLKSLSIIHVNLQRLMKKSHKQNKGKALFLPAPMSNRRAMDR